MPTESAESLSGVYLSWSTTYNMCVFITAVPITKLFARGGGTREEPFSSTARETSTMTSDSGVAHPAHSTSGTHLRACRMPTLP